MSRAISNIKATRLYVEQMQRENEKLRAEKGRLQKALTDLLQYSGGSDMPKSHPIGAAWLVLGEII